MLAFLLYLSLQNQFEWKERGFTLYLIVQVQVIKFSIGSEVLHVSVKGEIDVPPVALYDDGVPVVIIQEAACRHRCVAKNRAKLVAAWEQKQ